MKIKDVKTIDDVHEFRATVLQAMPPGKEKKELRAELRTKAREIRQKMIAETGNVAD